MASTTISFVCLILFFTLIGKGMCLNCAPNDVGLSEVATGKKVGGNPEWKVKIFTKCVCPEANVELACPGFVTAPNPAPSILVKGDKFFRVIPQITPISPVTFTYVADRQIGFVVASSTAEC